MTASPDRRHRSAVWHSQRHSCLKLTKKGAGFDARLARKRRRLHRPAQPNERSSRHTHTVKVCHVGHMSSWTSPPTRRTVVAADNTGITTEHHDSYIGGRVADGTAKARQRYPRLKEFLRRPVQRGRSQAVGRQRPNGHHAESSQSIERKLTERPLRCHARPRGDG